MQFREFHYRWEWTLQSTPDTIWPLIADTDRFNRDTGVPRLERAGGGPVTVTNSRRRLRLHRLGIALEWEEEPFEWTRPSRFGVVRRYSDGPMAEMRVLVELTPSPNGGTVLVYQVWARPGNWLGLIAIPIQIGLLSARRFKTTVRRYDRLTVGHRPSMAVPARVRFAPGGRERLAGVRDTLLADGARPDLTSKLVETIERSDESVVSPLRPYVLADEWGVERRWVLELCLLATRVGLLEFQWRLLCPLCRGSGESNKTLGDVRSNVHCESCNIDFTADFERSVELAFRPNPAIREIDAAQFCVGGPQLTPHIVVQQLMPAHTQRPLTVALEAGRYRLRTTARPGGQALSAHQDGPERATMRVDAGGWSGDELHVSTRPALLFDNATESEQLFILERMAWTDQSATAADVTALQLFRDLFASEALRPGEEFSVGSVAIVFTDLRSSTRLYREIGDAVAFGWVMSHFDVLTEAVAAEGGAVVKTIGDAVMAVFRRPAPALRAILTAQRRLASPADGSRPLSLKASLHYGPCIAVTLNDRLDYFGSTINIAARLTGQASGDGVLISTPVRNDPEVSTWLEEQAGKILVEPVEATLRGFDQQRFELWQVAQRDDALHSASSVADRAPRAPRR